MAVSARDVTAGKASVGDTTLSDVILLARALYCAPGPERAALARDLVDAAQSARRYVQSAGRVHPEQGDGTLGSAVLMRSVPAAPPVVTPDFAQCLIEAMRAIDAANSAASREAVAVSLRSQM